MEVGAAREGQRSSTLSTFPPFTEGRPDAALSPPRSSRPDAEVASPQRLGAAPSALSEHGGAGRGQASLSPGPRVVGRVLRSKPDPRVETRQVGRTGAGPKGAGRYKEYPKNESEREGGKRRAAVRAGRQLGVPGKF